MLGVGGSKNSYVNTSDWPNHLEPHSMCNNSGRKDDRIPCSSQSKECPSALISVCFVSTRRILFVKISSKRGQSKKTLHKTQADLPSPTKAQNVVEKL